VAAIRPRRAHPAHPLLVLAVVLPLVFSLLGAGLAARGNRDPEWRARVLRYFTAEDIERGRAYRAAFLPGSVARSAIVAGLLAFCLFAGGGRWLAEHAAAWSRGHTVLAAALVMLALGLALRLAQFPIDVYHGYVLEGSFGFRRLDFLPWLARLLKGHAIAIAIEVFLVAAFFALLGRFPRWWPALATAAGAAATFVFAIAWQAVVLPLFYQVSPLAPGPLRTGVADLAARAGVPVQEIRVIDHSRVSAHTNAFFTGIGSRREIYLYDTLSEQHDVPEVLAVVAHEIGHWTHQHVLKGWALAVLGMAVGFAALYALFAQPAFRAAARVAGPSDPALVPVLFALVAAASILVAPIENAVSRRFERESDRASLALTGDPATFIRMKVAMARGNRSQLLPHPFLVFWSATHPPVIERIEMAVRASRGANGASRGADAAPAQSPP
jgi:STE24 endopeptidase